ncbi:CHAT domain-containing protein [Herpetosiphon giganteus]|uniref:CHAT domain-containing protein n=1 Tax=Herpetosiphon giganteus TaxID=2029754 RepID=UPI0019563C31|nr:CHAT domain-containing protein [Herpetosiphon giganteus]MBM7843352.1 CHAT domain-containing protein [Herpetosiphon giganteus]
MTTVWLTEWLAKQRLTAQYQQGEALHQALQLVVFDWIPAVFAGLQQQAEANCWPDQGFSQCIIASAKQLALWHGNVQQYCELNQQQTNLPLQLPNLWQANQPTLSAKQIQAIRAFCSSVSNDPRSASWTMCVADEAELYACELHAHALFGNIIALWQPIIQALASNNELEAAMSLILLQRQLADYAGIIETFNRARAAHPQAAHELVPWLDNQLKPALIDDLRAMLEAVLLAYQLHNPPDRALLQALHQAIMALTPAEAGPDDDAGPTPSQQRGLPLPAVNVPMPNILRFATPATQTLNELKLVWQALLAGLVVDAQFGKRQQAVLQWWLAWTAQQVFQPTQAQQLLSQIPHCPAPLGLLLEALRGELAFGLGQPELAQHCFGSSIAASQALLDEQHFASHSRQNRAFVGLLAQWQGNSLMMLGDYTAAERCYARIAHLLAADDHEGQCLAAINRGNIAFVRNNLLDHRGYISYDKTEQVLLRGDQPPEAWLGLKYTKHRQALAQAEQAYAEALALAEQAPNLVSYRSLILANQANIAWLQANLVREAGWFSPNLAGSLHDLGPADQLYQQALHLLQKALATLNQTTPDRVLQAGLFANISEVQLLLGQPTAALSTAQNCLQALGLSELKPQAALKQAQMRGILIPEAGWRVWLTIARAHEALNDLPKAQQAYANACELVQLLRENVQQSDWQMAALQDKFQVFECAMHFHFKHATDRRRLLELSESLRGHGFEQLLAASQIERERELSPELKQQRAALAAAISARSMAIRLALQQPASADLVALLADQQAAFGAWQALQSSIAQALQNQDHGLQPQLANWPAVQTALAQRPNTVILSFTIGSEWSYLLYADSQQLQAFELACRAKIEYAVARLIWYVQRGAARWPEFVRANRAVVQLLFAELWAAGLKEQLRGKHIIIIPDGILYYLPFDLLFFDEPLAANQQPLDPATYRQTAPDQATPEQICHDLLPFYWLNHASISSAQSISLWLQLQQQTTPQAEHVALGVYNINYQTNVPSVYPGHIYAQELMLSYSDLSQTSVLSTVLAELAQHGPTVQLTAWQADHTPAQAELQSNEANFKRILNEQTMRYIIFAGHGVFNDKYPQFSGLVFNLAAPDGSSDHSGQDGFLAIHDLFELQLPQTELIFLAACQAGLGLISRGEGINSLTQALMYRGSPTIIASLWSVDVLATMDLVTAYFGLLGQQPNADKAAILTKAKQQVIAQPDKPHLAHPFYWAAFIPIGKR